MCAHRELSIALITIAFISSGFPLCTVTLSALHSEMSQRITRLSTSSLASKIANNLKNSKQNSDQAHTFHSKSKPLASKVKKRPQVKIEYEPSDLVSNEDEPSAAKKIKVFPSNWEEQLANIQEMRRKKDAPVDTMGCDVITDQKASPQVSNIMYL